MSYLMLGIGLAFVGFQVFAVVSTSGTEERPYEVMEKDGPFEIRYYPAVNMAAYSTSGDLNPSGSGQFGVLAGYIFGGNEKSQKIAMTSPVEMEPDAKGSTMRFMMPSQWQLDSLPKPNDSRIQLHRSEAFFAATLTFGGFANEEKITKWGDDLKEILRAKGLEFEDKVLFLGYNPPYQMVNRKNEVLIRLPAYQKPEMN